MTSRRLNLITSRLGCLLVGLWVLGCGYSSPAQTSLNVTNFGARGDAVQFYVNTVSNSVVVTTTNVLSAADIGKTIEIFAVGAVTMGISEYNVQATNNQDLIATITNVVNGTNIYISLASTNYPIPQATKTNAFATYGTDNTVAILSCIAAAGTNCVINFPSGTFLCMPTFSQNWGGYGYVAIRLWRGGLHFLGAGVTKTRLLSRGAWQIKNSQDGTISDGELFRGFLFETIAPLTNNYPVTVDSLTLDGGVQNGLTDLQGGDGADHVDGLGWDIQHSAWLAASTAAATGRSDLNLTTFTNVVVTRWRGEMLKTIDSETNANIHIYNCDFIDGNATALNIYGAWDVTSNRFEQLFQVTEYYQRFYNTPSYFKNNYITNITGNSLSINGGVPWCGLFTVQSNTFDIQVVGHNCIITTPACNVSFLNNTFNLQDYMTAFSIGADGSQGSVQNSNILISGNLVTGNHLTFASWGGVGAIQGVNGLTICSNTVNCMQYNPDIFYCGCNATNVSIHDNNFGNAMGQINISPAGGGMYPLMQANNYYIPWSTDVSSVQTNTIHYGSGPKQRMNYVDTGNVFILSDSDYSQIPAGAYFDVDNQSNHWASLNAGNGGGNGDITVFPSQIPNTVPMAVPAGKLLHFLWSGSAWTTNLNNFQLRLGSGSGSGVFAAGSVVTVTAGTVSGETFTRWTGTTNAMVNPLAATSTFTMPASDVTLTANYITTPVLLPPTGLTARSATNP